METSGHTIDTSARLRQAAALAVVSALLLGCATTTAQGEPGGVQAETSKTSSSAPAARIVDELVAVDGLPAEKLDLTNWKLTLPVGEPHHPTEIKQPALQTFKEDKFFYLSEQGVVFRAHAGGVTTPNSSYPRTELREMRSEGRERAAWATTKGRHTLVFRAAITKVPIAKPHVVAGQLHDAKDDVVMIRLEREHLFVEGGGNNLGTLEASYQLGTFFDAIIDSSDGRVRVFYNGEDTPRVDVERPAEGCYFKLGAYTQSNPTKGDSDQAYGEVVVSSVAVYHEE